MVAIQKRLLVVDGSNLLFQMFFGMPARIVNRNGEAIQGVLGFVGALLKILRMVAPTHAVVLFDSECPNERRELSADYKANRPDYDRVIEDENPFSQLPAVYAALDYLGLPHAEVTCGETDDAVAAYALTYGEEAKVIICSFDSDFFQLITENVSVLRYRGERSVCIDPAAFTEKFGIRPSQYADYKALTGDTADNIKGAEKIGPKTAAALMREFGSLERLLAETDRIGKPAVRASVEASADRLQLNYRLIKLQNTTPIPFSLEQLNYTDGGQTTTGVLLAIGVKP